MSDDLKETKTQSFTPLQNQVYTETSPTFIPQTFALQSPIFFSMSPYPGFTHPQPYFNPISSSPITLYQPETMPFDILSSNREAKLTASSYSMNINPNYISALSPGISPFPFILPFEQQMLYSPITSPLPTEYSWSTSPFSIQQTPPIRAIPTMPPQVVTSQLIPGIPPQQVVPLQPIPTIPQPIVQTQPTPTLTHPSAQPRPSTQPDISKKWPILEAKLLNETDLAKAKLQFCGFNKTYIEKVVATCGEFTSRLADALALYAKEIIEHRIPHDDLLILLFSKNVGNIHIFMDHFLFLQKEFPDEVRPINIIKAVNIHNDSENLKTLREHYKKLIPYFGVEKSTSMAIMRTKGIIAIHTASNCADKLRELNIPTDIAYKILCKQARNLTALTRNYEKFKLLGYPDRAIFKFALDIDNGYDILTKRSQPYSPIPYTYSQFFVPSDALVPWSELTTLSNSVEKKKRKATASSSVFPQPTPSNQFTGINVNPLLGSNPLHHMQQQQTYFPFFSSPHTPVLANVLPIDEAKLVTATNPNLFIEKPSGK